jgi:hypothetical protein
LLNLIDHTWFRIGDPEKIMAMLVNGNRDPAEAGGNK